MSDAPPEPVLISEVQARVARELDRLAPVLDPLGRRFAEAGHTLALVGGPVRDAMLGRSGNDLDFTTSAYACIWARIQQCRTTYTAPCVARCTSAFVSATGRAF